MTEKIAVHFTLTKPEMTEGIALASNTLLLPWQRFVSTVWGMLAAILAGAGSVGIVFVTYRAMTGFFPHGLVASGLFVVTGFAILSHFRVVLDWMATRALSFNDPEGTHMELDAQGLRVWATHEDRRLGWPAVHAITMGKNGLYFSVSGAAFILPKRVLDNPQAVFEQVQAWRKAAND